MHKRNSKTDLKKIYLPFLITAALFLFLVSGCKDSGKPSTFTIWTDREEIVSYTELFNSIHDDVKAVVVYKEHLTRSLPPARDEEKPDLLIGSWLKTSRMRRNFRKIDRIFSPDTIDPQSFYAPLLEYGRANNGQYLIPVSFNLPILIFSAKNENLVPQSFLIDTDSIRDTAAAFNEMNDHNFYTKMGFAPSWDSEFLYTVAKMNGAAFTEKGTSIIWNKESLENTVNYIKEWTEQKNTSTEAEQDFEFKYLYTPKYRQVSSGRCLYAYTTSGNIFGISSELPEDLDFRWISKDGKIPVEDNIVSLGIYRNSRNPDGAEEFIIWLLQENSQRQILERKARMNLDTETFGIAAGFSSLKSVNELILPAYYKNLLGNLPSQDSIQPPSSFPARWDSLKERVIIPYLQEAVKTETDSNYKTMEELLNSWAKQFD